MAMAARSSSPSLTISPSLSQRSVSTCSSLPFRPLSSYTSLSSSCTCSSSRKHRKTTGFTSSFVMEPEPASAKKKTTWSEVCRVDRVVDREPEITPEMQKFICETTQTIVLETLQEVFKSESLQNMFVRAIQELFQEMFQNLFRNPFRGLFGDDNKKDNNNTKKKI